MGALERNKFSKNNIPSLTLLPRVLVGIVVFNVLMRRLFFRGDDEHPTAKSGTRLLQMRPSVRVTCYMFGNILHM